MFSQSGAQSIHHLTLFLLLLLPLFISFVYKSHTWFWAHSWSLLYFYYFTPNPFLKSAFLFLSCYLLCLSLNFSPPLPFFINLTLSFSLCLSVCSLSKNSRVVGCRCSKHNSSSKTSAGFIFLSSSFLSSPLLSSRLLSSPLLSSPLLSPLSVLFSSISPDMEPCGSYSNYSHPSKLFVSVFHE